MHWPPQILVIAPESQDRDKLEKILAVNGVHVFSCATLLEAQSFLSGQLANAVFAQDALPDGDFRAVLADVARFQKDVPVVALTRNIDWDSYLRSMADGAFDCLAFPPSKLEAQRVLWSALQAFAATSRHEEVAAA